MLRPEIKIAIVSICTISDEEREVLDKYAATFGGYHINTESPSGLPQIVEQDPLYRSYYGYDRTDGRGADN